MSDGALDQAAVHAAPDTINDDESYGSSDRTHYVQGGTVVKSTELNENTFGRIC
jgi:hypothetical protein